MVSVDPYTEPGHAYYMSMYVCTLMDFKDFKTRERHFQGIFACKRTHRYIRCESPAHQMCMFIQHLYTTAYSILQKLRGNSLQHVVPLQL